MHTLHRPNSKRWRIQEGNRIIFSGVGSVANAFYIARLHNIVLVKFKESDYLKAA